MSHTILHDIFNREFQRGNLKLFNQLFTDYYVNLCRFAYTFVKDTGISEEIVQELFVSLWEQHSKLKINTSIRSFLYTSVKNRSLNYIRNEKTRVHHEDEYSKEQTSKVTQIIDFCEREELSHLINQSVHELPDQCRIIFEMSRKNNLTYIEIARKLSISSKTVENQMGIALIKLRNKILPYLPCVISLFVHHCCK